MTIALTCPDCGGRLKVPDHIAGKKVQCPKCSVIFRAPAPVEAAITAEALSPSQPDEGVTPTVVPPVEAVEEIAIEPRRIERNIRKEPVEDLVSTLIPKNGKALAAYYCGVFSFIPCLGLALGPVAFILGILGLRYAKANPAARGGGHAIAGIILGGLTSLGNWGTVITGIVVWIIGSMATNKAGQPIPRLTDSTQQAAVLFTSHRDLVDPNKNFTLAPELGRQGAVRVEKQINALAFSPDGKTLAVAGSTSVKLWDMATAQPRTIPNSAASLAFSPDGNHLAVGRPGARCVIELYNPTTVALERKVFEGGPQDTPSTIAFSSDGALFAATGNRTFTLWDVATWQKRPNGLKPQNWPISSLAFSPNSKTLAVGVGDSVLLWDTAAMNVKGSLKGNQGTVSSVAFSSDGKTVASGDFAGRIKLWDAEQQKELHALGGHRGRLRVMAFSRDGKTLASSGFDGFLKLWDIATKKELTNRTSNPPGDMVNAVAFSPDGKWLVTGSNNQGILKAWDMAVLVGPKPGR